MKSWLTCLYEYVFKLNMNITGVKKCLHRIDFTVFFYDRSGEEGVGKDLDILFSSISTQCVFPIRALVIGPGLQLQEL